MDHFVIMALVATFRNNGNYSRIRCYDAAGCYVGIILLRTSVCFISSLRTGGAFDSHLKHKIIPVTP